MTILIIIDKYVPMTGNNVEQTVYCTSIFTCLNMNCLCDIFIATSQRVFPLKWCPWRHHKDVIHIFTSSIISSLLILKCTWWGLQLCIRLGKGYVLGFLSGSESLRGHLVFLSFIHKCKHALWSNKLFCLQVKFKHRVLICNNSMNNLFHNGVLIQ